MTRSATASDWTSAVVRALLTAAAYLAAGRIGYAFAIPHAFLTLWPPAGLMLALLALSKRSDWPAILAGGIVGSIGSDLLAGYDIRLCVAEAFANASESVLAAWVLTSRTTTPVRLDSVRTVAVLVLGAAVGANAATSTLGALVLHNGFHTSWSTSWLEWWVGDGLGMLLVAPAVLAWANVKASPGRLSIARQIEALVLFVFVSLWSHEVFVGAETWSIRPGSYAVFPLLIWAALRFGPIGATTGSLIVASYAIWDAGLGRGPLVATSPITDTALQVYAFLLVVSLCALVPAVLLEERAVAERRRRESDVRFRETEDRLRFAMEAAQLGVWDVDFATARSRWSSTMAALHGLDTVDADEPLSAFLDRAHPDDRDAVRRTIELSGEIEYRTVWPDRSVHWISVVGRTTLDDRGQPTSAAGIALDVTERHALEARIRQGQKMDAIGQLAGGIAHDFNNLLTVILSYCTAAIDAARHGVAEIADLEEIKAAANRATALTRQLLAFSRRQIVSPRVIDVAESVAAMAPMLRRLIGEDIELVVRASNVGRVKADPSQIEQVVLNLVLNARDAMPRGGRLTLETVDLELREPQHHRHGDIRAGSYVMLAVTDTGIGMDDATLGHMFEPFFTTKTSTKGTGLGLATVYGIVKQTGGAVWVYSEVGHGTAFKVFLPRVDAPLERISSPHAHASVPCTETILVTEDDPSLRSIATRVLAEQGYTVLSAGSPSEAMQLAKAHAGTIHLLLTDVVLPEMSGRILAEHIVAARPSTRVLFMSGYTDDAVVRRGVFEAATKFLQKPFDPATLLARVREVLDVD